MKFNYESHSLKSGIYKITNTHTGRVYIGQAKEFKNRWKGHASSLRAGKHQNKFLQNDFNKCKEELGNDDFLVFDVLEVMEGSTKKERSDREELEIAKYFDKCKTCYNIKEKAGDTERSCYSKTPEETSRKQSERMKELWQDPEYVAKVKPAFEAAVHDPAIREKLSQVRKERWADPEYKASMSEKIKESKGTEENRQKVSEFMKEYKNSQEGKEKASASSKKMWENPEYRAAHHEAMMKTTSSQEYKEKQRQGFLKRKQDTEAWIEYQKQASAHSKQLHASGIMQVTEETKQKMSEAARKRHAEGRSSHLANTQFQPKEYEVIAPEGEVIKIDNLRLFCQVHDLDYQKFRRMAAGSSKEYAGYYTTRSRAPRHSTSHSQDAS